MLKVRSFGVLVTFLCSLVMGTTVLSAAEQHQIYSLKTLILTKWGPDINEFGLQEGEEIETVGPLTFSLNRIGDIYIFDSVKHNIKLFSNKGIYQNTFGSNVSGSALAIDDQSHVFVLHDHILHEYSPSGGLLKNHAISKDIQLVEGYGQGITIDDLGNLLVNKLQETYKIGVTMKQTGRTVTSSLSALEQKKQLASQKNGMVRKNKGNRFQTKWKNKQEAGLHILNNDGSLLKEVSMNTSDVFGSVLFLGKDDQDSIYVETERITKDNYVHLEVRKYGFGGNLLSIIELPNDYYTTVYKKIDVDNFGNIYQLLTTPQGVQIIKWQQKQ